MQTNTAEKIAPQGLKSILRSAQKPEPATAKGKTPVLDVSSEIRELATQASQYKKDLDTADAKFKEVSKRLTDLVNPLRLELAKREYTPTVRVPTLDGLSVTITWSGNFYKITPDSESQIIKIVGEQAYPEYFKSKFVISATDKTNEEIYKLFGWLAPDDSEQGLSIGQERFQEWFTVDEVIRPTERFVHDYALMPISKKSDLELAGVKPFNPSVKSR